MEEVRVGDFLQLHNSTLGEEGDGVVYYEVISVDTDKEWTMLTIRNHDLRTLTLVQKSDKELSVKVVRELEEGVEGPNLIPTGRP